MAIIGRFIGINNYRDSMIKDLNGAVKDAQALYGIFKDSFKEIEAKLIINEEATYENIQNNLNILLENAKEDDFIVISFSGHGSNDHHIIANDTKASEYQDTSIKMGEVATSFKLSKAKNILIILDCCFSGGTTAKVFDDNFISRDFTIPDFNYSGIGRVLVTASGFDQPAYENLNTGHGLLTNAFINVLTNKDDVIDLSSAMDDVLSLIQAEANSIGCKQTPIAFNLINGSFKIKKLHKGDHYYSFFPDFSSITITDDLNDLIKYNFPKEVIKVWTESIGPTLLPLQVSAINDNNILNGESVFVSAPTSSGKTFIGELASIKSILNGDKSVFLLPFRALVNEKYDKFLIQYQDKMDMRIIRCSGDYSDQISDFLKNKYDIAFFTYEMFLSIIVEFPYVLTKIGTIIVDEVQFISDNNRGIVVELILTRLKLLKSSGINPQLITLSATVDEINDFNHWLNLNTLVFKKRPIPLRYGVIGRDGIFHYREYDENVIKEEVILPAFHIVQRRSNRSSQDILIPLCQKILENPNNKILIFRNTRGAAEGCANYLGRDCGISNNDKIVNDLESLERTRTNQKLINCVQNGVAFHNSNLSREERKLIEDEYRNINSNLRILVSTSTLAAGINTPASHVIIVENGYPWENKKYSVGDVLNMAGRAGRLGIQETGVSFLLSESKIQTKNLLDEYIEYNDQKIESSFTSDNLFTWIIKLFAQVGKIQKNEITTLLSNTFGGYKQSINNPNWVHEFKDAINKLIALMIRFNLLSDTEDLIELTLLGLACGKSSLKFNSCIELIKLLQILPEKEITGYEFLASAQIIEELDNVYVPIQSRGNSESKWVTALARIIDNQLVRLLQKNTRDVKVYYKRCKKMVLLQKWMEGASITEIENIFYSNPYNLVALGDIQSIVNTNRYHIKSIYEIAFLSSPEKCPNNEVFETLMKQLEFGLPSDCLDLIDFPFSRDIKLQMIKSGIKNRNSFFDEEFRLEITNLIGDDLYSQLQEDGS